MSARVAVLGAGSWGTALAWLLCEKPDGPQLSLWARDAAHAAEVAARRENSRYLPGLALGPTVAPTADLERALHGAEVVVVAVPVGAVRGLLRLARPYLPPSARIALAAKGLERDTGLRLSEVAAAELGDRWAPRVGVLSGPNLAGEIVRRVPTATVVSAPEEATALVLQQLFGAPFFRVYTNRDLVGVELGGALKNPVAIAAGMSDGLGYGDNTKASLLTRGLAEMKRLGAAAGARPATFSGLSGLGDLMATAHSPLSRNYRLGLALGRGETLEHAREALHQVAEGVPTTEAACRLAARLGVEAPILQVVRSVLYEGLPPAEAAAALLARPYRDEDLPD